MAKCEKCGSKQMLPHKEGLKCFSCGHIQKKEHRKQYTNPFGDEISKYSK